MGLSVLAGEVVGSLNSALDHLVYGLSRTKPQGTGFPAYIDPVGYAARRGGGDRERLLAGVADANRAIIDAYQPYTGMMKGDPLWQMRQFANTDKHRITHPAFANPRHIRIHHPARCITTMGPIPTRRPLHNNAVLFRFRVECPHLPPNQRVQVGTEVDLSIAFGPTRIDLVELDQIAERVNDIIRCFSPAWPN